MLHGLVRRRRRRCPPLAALSFSWDEAALLRQSQKEEGLLGLGRESRAVTRRPPAAPPLPPPEHTPEHPEERSPDAHMLFLPPPPAAHRLSSSALNLRSPLAGRLLHGPAVLGAHRVPLPALDGAVGVGSAAPLPLQTGHHPRPDALAHRPRLAPAHQYSRPLRCHRRPRG